MREEKQYEIINLEESKQNSWQKLEYYLILNHIVLLLLLGI